MLGIFLFTPFFLKFIMEASQLLNQYRNRILLLCFIQLEKHLIFYEILDWSLHKYLLNQSFLEIFFHLSQQYD